MGTVQVFTADRMIDIENSSVVDGNVVGDNLILTTHDGTPIDAGNVRGPQGDVGPIGPSASMIVRAASPGSNVASLSGTFTLDGVALAVGDKVLLKDQTTASQNGIYTVNSGAWTRPNDYNDASEIAGAIVRVLAGTTNGGTRWVTNFKSTDSPGSSPIAYGRALDSFNASVITYSGTTDASGFLTVTHGLGWTPNLVIPINGNPGANFPVCWGVDTIGATTFRIRFMNASTAGAAVSIATGPQKALCLR